MATLNIKSLPDDLYRKLQAYAKRERRSVAKQVTQLLTEALESLEEGKSLPTLQLKGLGKEYWRDFDAAAYVENERAAHLGLPSPEFARDDRAEYLYSVNRSLHIDYPPTLPDALRQTPAEFEREARMAMAVKLFEMKRVSSGQAAQLAGVDRTTFLMRLSDHGAAMIDLPAEELADDVGNAGST